jgi:hypothetical protein
MEAARAVFALKESAFAHDIYFKSPLYEFVEGTQMYLKINGTQLPIYQREIVVDAVERMTKGERIEDQDAVKALIKELIKSDMRVYWWVMWLFADECVILKTESGASMFAFLGDVGVMHNAFKGSSFDEPCCECESDIFADDVVKEFLQ